MQEPTCPKTSDRLLWARPTHDLFNVCSGSSPKFVGHRYLWNNGMSVDVLFEPSSHGQIKAVPIKN